jgi:hypothetical protein
MLHLAGTGLAPPGPLAFLKAAADAGCRVISLAYNDPPSLLDFCHRNPVLACYDKFCGFTELAGVGEDGSAIVRQMLVVLDAGPDASEEAGARRRRRVGA